MGNETKEQRQERESLEQKEQSGNITEQEKQRLAELKRNQ